MLSTRNVSRLDSGCSSVWPAHFTTHGSCVRPGSEWQAWRTQPNANDEWIKNVVKATEVVRGMLQDSSYYATLAYLQISEK